MAPERETQKRCWMITKFQQDDSECLHEWMTLQWTSGVWKYLVGQVEVAPETGRYHLQAFGVLGTKKRLTQMKKLDADAHWEPMQGTMAQCKQYCTKEETRIEGPWEYGELKTAGRPNSLSECTKMVKEGKTDGEIAEEMPELYVRHYKGLHQLRIALKIAGPARDWPPEIWVLYGPSGTGKSRYANEHWPDAYWKSFGDPWWDMYTGEETIVLDDFRPGFMTLTCAQHLLDRYKMLVPIKGGYVQILAKRIVITSNLHPREWFEKDRECTILRRINDYAQGRFIFCGRDGWTDELTGAPWVEPGDGFPGNTSGNPAPASDAWEALINE